MPKSLYRSKCLAVILDPSMPRVLSPALICQDKSSSTLILLLLFLTDVATKHLDTGNVSNCVMEAEDELIN